jgi:hypothetical protein
MCRFSVALPEVFERVISYVSYKDTLTGLTSNFKRKIHSLNIWMNLSSVNPSSIIKSPKYYTGSCGLFVLIRFIARIKGKHWGKLDSAQVLAVYLWLLWNKLFNNCGVLGLTFVMEDIFFIIFMLEFCEWWCLTLYHDGNIHYRVAYVVLIMSVLIFTLL